MSTQKLQWKKFANSQAVRFGEKHEKAGQLALDANGKIQYRSVFFSSAGEEDRDLRTEALADMFLSPELEAELTGASHVIADQSM